MELVDGPSLADVLARGPLEPIRVMDIVAQAAAGLDAAHRWDSCTATSSQRTCFSLAAAW